MPRRKEEYFRKALQTFRAWWPTSSALLPQQTLQAMRPNAPSSLYPIGKLDHSKDKEQQQQEEEDYLLLLHHLLHYSSQVSRGTGGGGGGGAQSAFRGHAVLRLRFAFHGRHRAVAT
eukprot:scaffold1668_cov171-Ochromonas_danica.AAC.2